MTLDLSHLLWPVDRLPDALEQMAQRAGYGERFGELSAHAPDVEPSRSSMVALAGPAVLQIRRNGRPFYLVLLGKRLGKVRLLARDATVVSLDASRVLAIV